MQRYSGGGLLGVVAMVTRDVAPILWSMCLFAAVKAASPQLYGMWIKGFRVVGTDSALAKAQISCVFPFAVANGLFLLKVQADQWVVAISFPPAIFALISIAAVALSISTLILTPSIMHSCHKSIHC